MKYLTTFLLLSSLLATFGCSANNNLNLVPYPNQIELSSGSIPITSKTRIIATDSKLKDAAAVLQMDVWLAYGIKLKTVKTGNGKAGDIVLSFDKSIKGDGYTISVTDKALVKGSSYKGVVMGTVTILQALTKAGKALELPKMTVEDGPFYPMRAIQMCVKHQLHGIEKLKQGVDLCRQYKLNTLAPHFSNYQMLYLASENFRKPPLMERGRYERGTIYSPEEMKGLVEYGRKRGVAIMPQFSPDRFLWRNPDVTYLTKAEPKLTDYEKLGVEKNGPLPETMLDNPAGWAFINDFLGKISKIFYTAEYIHVGAVDGEVGGWSRESDKELRKKYGLRNSSDQWGWILKQIHAINKKHGKKTMAYEGVRRSAAKHVNLPKDVCFYAYNNHYYHTDQMIEDGYHVLNAAWRPLYIAQGYACQVEEIYNWDTLTLRHRWPSSPKIVIPQSPLLIGTLISTWEGTDLGHLEVLTERSAAMAAKAWNPITKYPYSQFEKALPATVDLLENIFYPMRPKIEGTLENDQLIGPANLHFGGYARDGRRRTGEIYYTDKATISFQPVNPSWNVYYTIERATNWRKPDYPSPTNSKAKRYTKPIVIDGEPIVFRAQCFDKNGVLMGNDFVKYLIKNKIFMEVEEFLTEPDEDGRYPWDLRFHKKAIVKFTHADGKPLRYLRAKSEKIKKDGLKENKYTGPIEIDDTTTFWLGTKDEKGYPHQFTVKSDGYRENLLTGDRMQVTATQGNKYKTSNPEIVVDGFAGDPDKHWSVKGPGTVTVEMPMVHQVDNIELFCWWGFDRRQYFYTIDVSQDGKNWTQIADMSKGKHKIRSVEMGYQHKFKARPVKFIRVNMTGNSANQYSHITEIRAYEAKGKP